MPGLSGPAAGAEKNPEGPPLKELSEQIHAWLARVEELPDPDVRDLLQDGLQTILGFYGAGLERIVALVGQPSAGEGTTSLDRLLEDDLVRSLLLVHGLHPQSLEERTEAALAEVRPYLKSHGGDVELVRFEEDRAVLRLLGTCHGCPSSLLTMQVAVRRALERACPDLSGLELEDEAKSSSCA